jgi:hypothetical protein
MNVAGTRFRVRNHHRRILGSATTNLSNKKAHVLRSALVQMAAWPAFPIASTAQGIFELCIRNSQAR